MLVTRLRRAITATLLAVAAGSIAPAGPVSGDQNVEFEGPPGAAAISLIGDSTLTGVRWYDDYGELRRYDFVLNAESCRRTIEQSCISREGYRSQNVISTMRDLDGRLGEVLVVMSGYNDPRWTIDEAIAGVLDEAQRQGVDHVVWLTLRTSSDVDYSDPQEQTSINTFREYNEQLVEAAEASDLLQIADWATFSNGATGWFEFDGVHLTAEGVDALTFYLAGIVDRVLAGEDVSPAAAPWTVLVPGAEGDDVAAVQSALIDEGIEVRGGADGVFGYDTMAAVADYQRASGDLQVTGAVDTATARALGVIAPDDQPTGSDAGTGGTPPAATPAASTESPTAEPRLEEEPTTSSLGVPWLAVAAGGFLALVLAVIARRRWVVRRRRARRRARVHPATSPHRSVADLRRQGGPVPSDRRPTPDAPQYGDAGAERTPERSF